MKGKDSKFARDTSAFSEGRAYHWPLPKWYFQTKSFKNKNTPSYSRREGGNTSDSSCESSVSAFPQQNPKLIKEGDIRRKGP